MNVSLGPELERYVQAKVASGLYQTASEVVREALRLLRERDEVHRQRVEALDTAIEAGLASLAAEPPVDGDGYFAQRKKARRGRSA